MTQYIENPAGGIHSVDDTFELPTDAAGNVIPGWSFVEVERVPTHVLGTESDPVVEQAQVNAGGGDVIPEQPSVDPLDLPPTQAVAAETPAENAAVAESAPAPAAIPDPTTSETAPVAAETPAESAPEVQA